jgi:hypothetical protein
MDASLMPITAYPPLEVRLCLRHREELLGAGIRWMTDQQGPGRRILLGADLPALVSNWTVRRGYWSSLGETVILEMEFKRESGPGMLTVELTNEHVRSLSAVLNECVRQLDAKSEER